MEYRAIVKRNFIDKDSKQLHKMNTTYTTSDKERAEYLVNNGWLHSIQNDKQEEEQKSEYPTHQGGGYFVLSNGEKIRGKEQAIEAQKQIEDDTDD